MKVTLWKGWSNTAKNLSLNVVIKKYLAELCVIILTDFVVAYKREIIASHNGIIEDEVFKNK